MTIKAELIQLIKDRAIYEPVRLSSGEETDIYLDIKHVLDTGDNLNLALNVFCDHVSDNQLADLMGGGLDAVGGPTMGADLLSLGLVTHYALMRWFSIRKPKTGHGLGKTIEGTTLMPGDRVLLVDDVVNSGKSLMESYGYIRDTGAKVIAVVPLVDRGDRGRDWFGPKFGLNIPYHPVLTYRDLDIFPIVH